GLPAQAAPLLRIRQLPDDPLEPYSPNYGGANPASRRSVPSTLSQQAATARPKLPDDLPLDFMRQLAEATAGSQCLAASPQSSVYARGIAEDVTIVRCLEAARAGELKAALDAIFFEASNTQSF